MAQYSSGEAEFMKVSQFKNAWFWIIAFLTVVVLLFGLILIGTVYLTSGIRFDPTNFGMPSLDDLDPNE